MVTTEQKDAPGGVRCADARRLLAVFVRGDLPARGRSLLMRHVANCEPCRVDYRTSLEAIGRLGATVRQARAAAEREAHASRRTRNRREAIQASDGSKRKLRGAFLRLTLLPAAVVFLISRLATLQQPPRPFEVEWMGGTVTVEDTSLGAAESEAKLYAAQWCSTDEHGAARVTGLDVEVGLGADTQLLLEDARHGRFLLRAGRVMIDGPCELTTPLGVVTVNRGAVAVSYRDRELRAESFGGALELTNAAGRSVLADGDPPLVVR